MKRVQSDESAPKKTKNISEKEEELLAYQNQVVPKYDFTPHVQSSGNKLKKTDEKHCGICEKTFSVYSVINSCCHSYCFRCICEWTKRKTKCPVCSKEFQHILYEKIPEKKVGSYYVFSFKNDELPILKLLRSYLNRLALHNKVRPNKYLNSFIKTIFNNMLDIMGWFSRWAAIKNGAPLQHKDCIDDILCRNIYISCFVSDCEAFHYLESSDPCKGQLSEAHLSSKKKSAQNVINNDCGSCGVSNDNVSDDSFDGELEKGPKPGTRVLWLRSRAVIK